MLMLHLLLLRFFVCFCCCNLSADVNDAAPVFAAEAVTAPAAATVNSAADGADDLIAYVIDAAAVLALIM